jgi:hypothetical protein
MTSRHLLRLMLVCAAVCVQSNASAAVETIGPVGAVSGSGIVATDAAVIKLLLYSDRSGLGDCNLLGSPWVQGDELSYGIFAHSCRTRPGLSGTPIVVRIAGEPVAIGINLGYRLRPPQLKGPLFYGIGRAFDAEIAATIDRAVQRAAHTPAAAGR